MFLSQRRPVVVVGLTSLALCAVMGVFAFVFGPAAERRKVFDQTWRVVDEKYYDRSKNGLDWPAVREVYLAKLQNIDSSTELYREVLNPMLVLLESSHVGTITPMAAEKHEFVGIPQAMMPYPLVETCGGYLIAYPSRSISPRIASMDTNSYLGKRGVRAGWRLTGWSQSEENGSGFTLGFVTTSGEIQSTAIEPEDSIAPDVHVIKKEYGILGGLLAERAVPTTRIRMDSLGIDVVIGKNAELPTVVDVWNGSVAERAGMEPGSTVMRYQRVAKKNGGGHEIEAEFVSPAGKSYSVAFEFDACEIPERDAQLLAERILHIRFDRFKPGIVSWLDEQVRTNPAAVVLDLRRNIGGDLPVLADVMGRFLDAGTPIGEEIRTARSHTYTANTAPHVYAGPVAVLVSRASSSAAEISAAALRFHGRAMVYGQNTSGDVLLSQNYSLADGGIVQMAIADVLGADGKRLENVGVKPDFEIMPTLETVRAGRDVVLEAAVTDLKQTLH